MHVMHLIHGSRTHQSLPATAALLSILIALSIHINAFHAYGACFQWDVRGDVLAVLPAGSSFIYTWSCSSKELQTLETDFKVSTHSFGKIAQVPR
jgi:hypothetical protein